jgi:DNA-binding transcriptional ArsR family regulator
MKTFTKIIKSKDIYKEYIGILNGKLQLSGKEMEVLSLLLEIEMTKLPILGKKQDLLSTDNRRALMDETGITKTNLSKYLSELKDRGIIKKDEEGHYINKMFIPDIEENKSETIFILNLKENE